MYLLGNIYIADVGNHRIRKITIQSTLGPTASPSYAPSCTPSYRPSYIPRYVYYHLIDACLTSRHVL